jgi:hypothetical protein
MITSRRRSFRYFLIGCSLIFSLFSPTLQSLVSNKGIWPGFGFYPITEIYNPNYWNQMLAWIIYAMAFYFSVLLVISCEYYSSTKISTFILSWIACIAIFMLASTVLGIPYLDFGGDLIYRSAAMGFVTLMFGEILLKKLQKRNFSANELLPGYLVSMCEALSMFRNHD